MVFWSVAVILAAASFWAIARPLLRTQSDAPKAAEQDLQVYKDQLAEVERDLAKGSLTDAEAESARIEVSRRILAADKRLQDGEAQTSGVGPRAGVVALAAVIVFAGSAALYVNRGHPGLTDRPLAQRLAEAQAARDARPSQEEAEAAVGPIKVDVEPTEDYLKLVGQLRTALADRPNDLQGHRLLATHEARIGNFSAARKAQARVVELAGGDATAEDFTALAEYGIFAASGYVSRSTESALVQALQKDPANPRARYYSGLAMAQNGRPDVTYRMWVALLEESPADAPWVQLIRSQIADVAQAAGIDPATLPGPSASDVEQAGEMSDAEREDMIRGMVSGLAERLATEGGTAEEWARLIRAYGVLGELDNAALIWTEAKETFAGNDAAMKLLTKEAEELGIN